MIVFSRSLHAHVRRAAERAYPEESCGLLVGRLLSGEGGETLVTRVVESENVAVGDRCNSFEIDPIIRLRLQRQVRGGSEAIVAIYHSHPDGPAAPSERDATAAWEPELIWVITAVAQGRAGKMTAHGLLKAEGPFNEMALVVIDD